MPVFLWIALLLIVVIAAVAVHQLRVRALKRRLAEREPAIRKVDELTALDRVKSRILLELLNELRTPLMLLRGGLKARTLAAAAAPSSADPADLLGHADRIRQGVDQLTEILELDLGDARLDRSRADLAAVLQEQVSSLKPAAERHGITIAFTTDPLVLPLSMDRQKVERAVYGLLHRAFDATQRGDHVQVDLTRSTTESGADVALIAVRDGGRPIDEGYRDLLEADEHWTSFPQAMGDMTGLSLALTRRFTEMHGGTVSVARDVAEGSIVRITLPLTPHASAEMDHVRSAGEAEERSVEEFPEETVFAPPERPLRTKEERREQTTQAAAEKETTVLVVDDNADTRLYLRHALGRQHNILEAGDGREALETVREKRPDLVVSDIMMPVMDGHELCRRIKSDEELNHIPVLLVTANAVPDVKMEGLESGADDYLVKPFDTEEALVRINNMIRTRSRLRERYSREVVIKPTDVAVTSEEEAFLERARTLVEEHIDDGDFGVQELSAELGLSSRQLQRKLRDTVDQSPVEFIRTLRLQRAAQLLEKKYGNVSEVAYAVGFTSLSYFAKCFREQYGQPPSEYKASHE